MNRFAGDERILVVGVPESAQGGRDRNADGDTLDEVALAIDVERGARHDLAVALSPFFPAPLTVAGRMAAIVVSEAEQGQTDLNQDGDALDDVLEVLDSVEGPGLLGPRLALAPLAPLMDGGAIAFAVSEAAEGGHDLNGDGDALDAVPRVFLRFAGLAEGPDLAVSALLGLHGGWLAFTTDEAQLGSDLNGDGDALDANVLHFFEPGSGALVNTGLDASHSVNIGPGILTVVTSDWLVLVDEAAQGDDLDGDVDLEDVVVHAVSPLRGRIANLGVACFPRAPEVEPAGRRAAFLAREGPGLDRNGDGDFDDVTSMTYHVSGDTLLDSGKAVEPTLLGEAWVSGLRAFEVSEAAEEADRNGDGDALDLVVHVARGGNVENLRLDSQGLVGAPAHALIPRFEGDSGVDWNGDGDQQDRILFTWEAATGLVRSTAIAGLALGASDEHLLLAVPESADGRDWNGDGDQGDLVYVQHVLASGQNLGLGLQGAFAGAGLVLAGDRSVVLADEAAMQVDLNLDGDQDDSVPFLID